MVVKFLRKFENHGIKITLVNSILITKSMIYSYLLWFCIVLWFLYVVDIFKLTASAESPFIEVYNTGRTCHYYDQCG